MRADDLADMRVALARIEERQEAALQRARRIEDKLDTFALRGDLLPLQERIERVERTQTFVLRAAMVGFSTVMGGLFALGRRIGLS